MTENGDKSAVWGVLAMATSCTVWGLSALYYRLIAHVPPLEVLSHRTLWAFVFLFILLLVRGRTGDLWRLLGQVRTLALVALAGLLVSANWFLFIYSVQIDRVMESSLGYYIFPLVAVALGYVVWGERPSRWQGVAIGLAAEPVFSLAMRASTQLMDPSAYIDAVLGSER